MSNLKLMNEAWLGLEEVEKECLINPFEIIDWDANDAPYKLSWLMSRPEYFSFICKHIFNIDLLPSQSLFLHEMWNRKFPMLIASRGFGKSFSLSLYAMLRALLIPDRKVSGTMRLS
jgi:hypothetical protein